MKKYVVRAGDTMWGIAKRTGVRLNLLMAANPQITDPNNLTTGQVVMIPELTKKPTPPKPSVQLPQMPMQAPMQAGVPGKAQPGIPAPAPTPVPAAGQEHIPAYFGFVWPHVVGPNETWQSIASQYGLTQQQLQHLNPMETPNTLNEGDVLYVPAIGPMQPGAQESVPPMGSHGMPWMQTQDQMPWMQPDMQQMPYPTQPGMQPGMDMGAMPGMQPGMGMGPAAGAGYGGQSGYPGVRGYEEDDGYWEWQAWGWADVPFTTYQIPYRQHHSGQ